MKKGDTIILRNDTSSRDYPYNIYYEKKYFTIAYITNQTVYIKELNEDMCNNKYNMDFDFPDDEPYDSFNMSYLNDEYVVYDFRKEKLKRVLDEL